MYYSSLNLMESYFVLFFPPLEPGMNILIIKMILSIYMPYLSQTTGSPTQNYITLQQR